jgi:hypothetical protein
VPGSGFWLHCFGFFGSRLLLFWPLAMIVSWVAYNGPNAVPDSRRPNIWVPRPRKLGPGCWLKPRQLRILGLTRPQRRKRRVNRTSSEQFFDIVEIAVGGRKYRQIMVDLNPAALQATGISPNDVLNAFNPQSLTLMRFTGRTILASSPGSPG